MHYATIVFIFLQKNIFKLVADFIPQIFLAPSLQLPTFLCMCGYDYRETFSLQD